MTATARKCRGTFLTSRRRRGLHRRSTLVGTGYEGEVQDDFMERYLPSETRYGVSVLCRYCLLVHTEGQLRSCTSMEAARGIPNETTA